MGAKRKKNKVVSRGMGVPEGERVWEVKGRVVTLNKGVREGLDI